GPACGGGAPVAADRVVGVGGLAHGLQFGADLAPVLALVFGPRQPRPALAPAVEEPVLQARRPAHRLQQADAAHRRHQPRVEGGVMLVGATSGLHQRRPYLSLDRRLIVLPRTRSSARRWARLVAAASRSSRSLA